MSENPTNRVTHGISMHEPIDMCEGHVAEENVLIAKLFGKDRAPLSEQEEYEARHRLDVIQREMEERNERLDQPIGPIWRGM